MAEAFLDRRAGETRLAIADSARLVEMHLWRDGDGVAAGAVIDARLSHRMGPRGIAVAGSEELLVEPWPEGLAEGAMARLRIVRGSWREPGRPRLARAKPAPGVALAPAPSPEELADQRGAALRPAWPEPIATQWDTAFEAAGIGRLAIPGGSLCFQPTAAFTAVDVDGAAPDPGAALVALARAIRLWRLGGSVIIDLPAAGRAARQDAVGRLDAALAGQPFERTAINGFGTLQLVLPRAGPSILERAMLEPEATAAIALLAAAAAEPRPGALRLTAAPAVARWLRARPQLVANLARAAGRRVDVAEDSMAGTGHVHVIPPARR